MTSSRSGLYLALRDAVSAHLRVGIFFSPRLPPSSLTHANDNYAVPVNASFTRVLREFVSFETGRVRWNGTFERNGSKRRKTLE